MLRSPVFWVFAGFFALVIASLFVRREERGEFCDSCLSSRTVVAWGVGVPGDKGWDVYHRVVEETPSVAMQGLFGSRHTHRWWAPNGCRQSLLWVRGWLAHASINRFISDYDTQALMLVSHGPGEPLDLGRPGQRVRPACGLTALL